MPKEIIGDSVTVFTDDHPPRTDSPEYVKSRAWLQQTHGACLICGDPKIEDHHSGLTWIADKPLGFMLFGMEWSAIWSANPQAVSRAVANLNIALKALGEATYDAPIETTQDIAALVDSTFNASAPLCRAHHMAHANVKTPDHLGHEAVGIHMIPFPIWMMQMTNDWSRWDMFAGTSGTIAVGMDPAQLGHAVVLHVHADHPDQSLKVGTVLPPDHPNSVAAHAPQTT